MKQLPKPKKRKPKKKPYTVVDDQDLQGVRLEHFLFDLEGMIGDKIIFIMNEKTQTLCQVRSAQIIEGSIQIQVVE